MLVTDWDFLLTDLARLGMTSRVQIERRTKAGRTARGAVTEQVVPVGGVIDALLTDEDTTDAPRGFGRAMEDGLRALLPPTTDCTARDELVVQTGFQAGRRFRVLTVRRVPGDAGVLAAHLEERVA